MEDSLQISGRWVNKTNGEIVNVHNNIIDGDQMIIITDKGNLTMDEFSNYIQASDDIYNEQGQIIDSKPLEINEIKLDNNDELLNMPIGNKSFIKDNSSHNKVKHNEVKKESEPESFKILDKFFSKIENKENLITVDIDLEILPKEKLNTIVDYMDISIEDLSNYIAKNIVNTKNLPNIIFNKLQSWI